MLPVVKGVIKKCFPGIQVIDLDRDGLPIPFQGTVNVTNEFAAIPLHFRIRFAANKY